MRNLLAIIVVIGVGCGGGPTIIGGHDHSAFYDFGGFEDTVAMDEGATDAEDRETVTDVSGGDPDSVLPGDATHEDTNQPDTSEPDASPDQPGATFVSNRAFESRANAMIGGAKATIDIVHLEFLTYSPDDISIASSLKAAAGRGVKVRVMLDDDVDKNPDRVSDLNDVDNITARLDDNGISTHVKLIVVDDSQVLTGSTNLSKSALHFNNETNLWITDAGAVSRFAGYFEAVWKAPGTKVRLNATMSQSGILPIGDGEYAGAVEGYIEGATDRIMLIMYDYNYASAVIYDLTDRLTDAAGRGVDVRVFLEQSDDDYNAYVDENNREAAEILEQGGVQVRFDQLNATVDVTTHAKLLIVDDMVTIYSGNWSRSGMQDNHEAGAVVEGIESVTEDASGYFENLWKSGVDYP